MYNKQCEIVSHNISYDENLDLISLNKKNIEQFKNIERAQASKKSDYNYEYLYGIHLGPYRNKIINFLAIGIDCEENPTNENSGKTIDIWRQYLPNAELYGLEKNSMCANIFKNKMKDIFIGDQSDLNLLYSIGQEVGEFDVIVDDGGHSRKQQINSFIGLWPFLKSGGIYIVEDMYYNTLNDKTYYDNKESFMDLVTALFILFNNPLEIQNVMNSGKKPFKPIVQIQKHAKEISNDLLSFSCYKRSCVFQKKF